MCLCNTARKPPSYKVTLLHIPLSKVRISLNIRVSDGSTG